MANRVVGSVFGHPAVQFASLAILLVLVAWLYWPGIEGGFLFDDYPNLQLLERIAVQPDGTKGVLAYLDGSFAGPTKRPVSMLSFLVEYAHWPDSPAQFKRNNILYHLATTLSVAWLALLVARRYRKSEATAVVIALLTAALFALHPIQVSTVLYVVQRMAILAALFCALALVAFLKGVDQVERGRRTGWFLLCLVYPLLGLLALLSKENGVLVVLLAAVLIYFLPLDHARLRPASSKQLRALVYGPAAIFLLLFAALFVRVMLTNPNLTGREFTVVERLLTQPRILLDYLSLIFPPRMQSAGVYNDGVTISTSLFTPLTTLPAMLVVTALIAVALLRGRRYPLVGIGVVGFFAAHLIESSFIGLELYFEHRNYLPCMFLFMGCAGLLVELLEKRKIAGIVAIALIVGVCGTMTKLNAELWANNWQMFMVWAEQTPESERAQLQVAAFWADAGEYEKALDYTRKAAVARPKSPRPLIYAAAIKCYAGMPVDEAALARILEALQTYPYHQSTYNYFKELLKAKHVTRCDVPYATLTVLVEALFPDQIPSNNIRALKHYELGNLQLAQGHGAEGAAEYAKGAVMRADRQAGLVEASTLATLGFPALALEHLALVERRNNQICGVDRSLPRLNECEWLASEIVRLRSLIEIDQAQAGAP